MGNNFSVFQEAESKSCFFLIKTRVFLVNQTLKKAVSTIPRENLFSVGTHLGKFTKTGKFRLQITALDYLAHYAEHKVWLKQDFEGSWLYGNHVPRRCILKLTDAPAKQHIVVCSSANVPLGFGLTTKEAELIRQSNADSAAVINIADCGLYLRQEKEMFGLATIEDHLEMTN